MDVVEVVIMDVDENVVVPSMPVVEMIVPLAVKGRSAPLLEYLTVSSDCNGLPLVLEMMVSSIPSNCNHLHSSSFYILTPSSHIPQILETMQIFKSSA